MAASHLALPTITFCVFLGTTTTAGKTGRITVYWGQSASEGSLRRACESDLYSTIIISFLTDLERRGPRRQVLPAVQGCPHAPAIGGGGGRYSRVSRADAKAVADQLWDVYLSRVSSSQSRPFGDAVLDGVDLDIELGSARHYDDFARYLKDYSGKRERKRKVWVAATLQYPFPDRLLGEALRTGLFDRVHVQFYNNPACSYRVGNEGAFARAWSTWAASLPGSSVYLGLPVAPREAGSGYVPLAKLVAKVLPVMQRSRNYGGVMLWSRYWDLQNGYGKAIQPAV